MTPDQAATVRRTFQFVEAIQEQVAVLFYRRLLGLDPQIAVLFEGRDLERQRRDLSRSLARAVAGLNEAAGAGRGDGAPAAGLAIPGLPADARELAGTALVWALAKALGAAFTAEVEAAWRAALGLSADQAAGLREPVDVRRPRRPAASSSRASDTPRSTHPAPPA